MARSISLLYYLIYISVGFLYPAYCSMIALESKSPKDDIAWLMYWIVFALFNFIQFFSDYIFRWFPLYNVAKLGFLAWCVAPIGENGAFYLYKVFIQPFFRMYRGDIESFFTHAVEHTKEAYNYIPKYN